MIVLSHQFRQNSIINVIQHFTRLFFIKCLPTVILFESACFSFPFSVFLNFINQLQKDYCWKAFYKKEPREMLDYINDTVLPRLVDKYNHSGDVFSNKLRIQNPNILKQIVDGLSELTLLDVDSDVKGDAFEYFLKNSVTVGNDLGEYYT